MGIEGEGEGEGEIKSPSLINPNFSIHRLKRKMARSQSNSLSDRLFSILCHALILQFPAKTFGIRMDPSLLMKPICRNTVQGRYLISDDNGYVCDALSRDTWSQCCPETGDRFPCQGCNLVSQCCKSYEFCVSCCLNPSQTKKELALTVKIAKPVTAGTYGSVFDFCAGQCRHNSASVVHENAYASDFHHCFSLPTNSSGATDTPSEARLTGINIVIGRQGESCNSVCKANGQSCVPNKLLVLNTCELLQKYMTCKGACLASIGGDQPAEVVDDAPHHLATVARARNVPSTKFVAWSVQCGAISLDHQTA